MKIIYLLHIREKHLILKVLFERTMIERLHDNLTASAASDEIENIRFARLHLQFTETTRAFL